MNNKTEVSVDNAYQKNNLIKISKHMKTMKRVNRFYQDTENSNIFIVDSENTIFFLIDLNDKWIDLKKKINNNINRKKDSCIICNDNCTFNRFIFCPQCNKEQCLACSVINTHINDVFKCPFCRNISNELSIFLTHLVAETPNEKEKNLTCKCQCGRIAEDDCTKCDRYPACLNKFLYP